MNDGARVLALLSAAALGCNLRDELCSLPVSLMQLFVTRDAPCYWQCLPVSSCRMTSNEHEVPVFTVQSPTLHVVPLLSMQSKG